MLVFPTSIRFFAAALMAAVLGSTAAPAAAETDEVEAGGARGARAGLVAQRPTGNLDALLDRIDASQQQRVQVRSLLLGAVADLRASQDALQALRLEGARDPALADPAARAALQRRVAALHEAAWRRRVALLLEVSRLLTPDQRAVLATRADADRPAAGPPHLS